MRQRIDHHGPHRARVGHRLGTAEVESALVAHEAVAEAAVVGYPHSIKGQGIYAYVILTADYARQDPAQLQGALVTITGTEIVELPTMTKTTNTT